MKKLGMAAIAVLLFTAGALAQFGDEAKVAPAAEAKFAPMTTAFPACVTMAPSNGDPAAGAFVVNLKIAAGCTVPSHWHTANESLMFVSGKAKLDMKDMPSHALASGDYVYLPAKHVHALTCQTACKLFVSSDGKFDIHYVDKDGNEIPTEQALKASGKGMKKAAAEKKKPE
jgi:quercetin dioxygenase-like cupin family protein